MRVPRKMSITPRWMTLLPLLLMLLPPSWLEAAGRCIACHDRQAKTMGPHAAATGGQCLTCHRSKGSLPASGRHAKDAFAEVPGSACTGCHKQLAAKLKKLRFVHGPVAVTACSYCHTTHGGKGQHQLRTTGKGLCYKCHNDKRLKASGHGSKRPSCGHCHDAHGEKNANLVRQTVSKSCRRCHKDLLPAKPRASTPAKKTLSSLPAP